MVTYPHVDNLSLPSLILIIFHVIVSWPWLMDISPRSRSQFTHGKIFFPDHYLSWVSQMGMILHTIVIHDPAVVVAGGICPLMTCLVFPNVCNSPFEILTSNVAHELFRHNRDQARLLWGLACCYPIYWRIEVHFLFAVGNERTRVTCKSCDARRFGLIGRDLYC